jgi:hypothetical protein
VKNVTAPRTLADSQFFVGYSAADHPRRPVPVGERVAGVVLATVIGIVVAAATVHWWSAT